MDPAKDSGEGRTGTGVHPCTIIKTAGWWGLSESLAGVDTQIFQVDLGGSDLGKTWVGKDASNMAGLDVLKRLQL